MTTNSENNFLKNEIQGYLLLSSMELIKRDK